MYLKWCDHDVRADGLTRLMDRQIVDRQTHRQIHIQTTRQEEN